MHFTIFCYFFSNFLDSVSIIIKSEVLFFWQWPTCEWTSCLCVSAELPASSQTFSHNYVCWLSWAIRARDVGPQALRAMSSLTIRVRQCCVPASAVCADLPSTCNMTGNVRHIQQGHRDISLFLWLQWAANQRMSFNGKSKYTHSDVHCKSLYSIWCIVEINLYVPPTLSHNWYFCFHLSSSFVRLVLACYTQLLVASWCKHTCFGTVGVLGENPYSYNNNMQTLHRKVLSPIAATTKLPCHQLCASTT